MTDAIDLSDLKRSLPIEVTAEQDLAVRRRLAGRRGYQLSGGDPTRTTKGEWMWRTTLDLPEAMQLELETLATAQGVTEDQIVREALVAFGIGNLSHVAGICDGSHSDDDLRRGSDAEAGVLSAIRVPRPDRPGTDR